MKAIQTKYLPATGRRGSRIKAFDADGNSITLPLDHGLNQDARHRQAAEALRDKMGWKGELIQGGLKDGEVFVFAHSKQKP